MKTDHSTSYYTNATFLLCFIIYRTKDYPQLTEHPLVAKIAKNHGKTTAQILLRHLIQYNISVIPKSVNTERVKQNFQVGSAFFGMNMKEFATY